MTVSKLPINLHEAGYLLVYAPTLHVENQEGKTITLRFWAARRIGVFEWAAQARRVLHRSALPCAKHNHAGTSQCPTCSRQTMPINENRVVVPVESHKALTSLWSVWRKTASTYISCGVPSVRGRFSLEIIRTGCP